MGMRHEMDILRIAVLGIAGVLLALLLQKEKSEYSMFISMAVCICIFIYIITKVQIVLEFVERWRLSSILQKKCRRLLQWIRRISH